MKTIQKRNPVMRLRRFISFTELELVGDLRKEREKDKFMCFSLEKTEIPRRFGKKSATLSYMAHFVILKKVFYNRTDWRLPNLLGAWDGCVVSCPVAEQSCRRQLTIPLNYIYKSNVLKTYTWMFCQEKESKSKRKESVINNHIVKERFRAVHTMYHYACF